MRTGKELNTPIDFQKEHYRQRINTAITQSCDLDLIAGICLLLEEQQESRHPKNRLILRRSG